VARPGGGGPGPPCEPTHAATGSGTRASVGSNPGDPATGETVHVGIDENGLGPRLGPLVVTAVTARVRGAGDKLVRSRPRGGLRDRLGDSKRLVAFGDSALGEAWARAIAPRMGLPSPEGPDALVRLLSLDGHDVLRAPCPGDHAQQCWAAASEAFGAEPELLAKVRSDLTTLEARGVSVRRVSCIVTCTRRINEGIDRGLTRFHVDLHAMERLTLDARAREGVEVVAACGKVGGFDRYGAAFGPLNGRPCAIAEEGRARSEYRIAGLGRIAFVRDAEDTHPLVAMASLIGKWVRDLLMARIVAYHRAEDADLPNASGYHDPVTSRFVEATRLARRRRALPDDCFERRSLEREPRSSLAALPLRRDPIG
jgi:ribonuclease HII